MITCRWSGVLSACCTMASVIAATSLRFWCTVRPGHNCTVTTGISNLLVLSLRGARQRRNPEALEDGTGVRHGVATSPLRLLAMTLVQIPLSYFLRRHCFFSFEPGSAAPRDRGLRSPSL